MSKDTEEEAGQEQKVPALRVCPNFPHPAAHLYSLLEHLLLQPYHHTCGTSLQPDLSFFFSPTYPLILFWFGFLFIYLSSHLEFFQEKQTVHVHDMAKAGGWILHPSVFCNFCASCRAAGNSGRLTPESLASFLPHCFITNRGLADSTYARRCYSVL